ncbi:MAG: fumarylacetoacetate hydrolase family protein [Proteobacteria bacterium]|nr:fumarylacetoacetate hydrolase family protein [Pseudomonadota bacterium]
MSKELANRIWRTRTGGGLLARAELDAVKSRDDAYALQAQAIAASGMTPAGWKVAATSKAAQELLAVTGPLLGPVFMEQCWSAKMPVPSTPEQATAVECEFAYVMDRDLAGGPLDRATVEAAVRMVFPAVEVVGCRFQGGFKGAGEIVCISDFAFNAGLVLGPALDNWRNIDLISAAVVLTLNGKEVAKGTGAAVLGDPMQALVWAANEAARIGMPLMAGEVVSTGTMTGATLVKSGDAAIADFGPLGKIELTVA